MIVFDVLILILLIYIVFWQLSLLIVSVFSAPSVYANSHAIDDAMNLAQIKPGQLIIDLGCGDGRSLIIAAKKYHCRGIGVEISPLCYLRAKIRVAVAGESKYIQIYFGDFHSIEDKIKQADMLYLYLLNSTLNKIEDWLFSILKPGAKIVVLCFGFSQHQPKKITKTHNLGRETTLKLYTKQN